MRTLIAGFALGTIALLLGGCAGGNLSSNSFLPSASLHPAGVVGGGPSPAGGVVGGGPSPAGGVVGGGPSPAQHRHR
ncbi:MAG: hypothetical protein JO146_06510 [Candidatus Eremiobacteraeota bacterium]|nr:hypothetical protein [Candidatus Eremiobacteraeota bacterium]